jgi:GrpB-like predicted nucleotidyltransferase (UPF0157 family)
VPYDPEWPREFRRIRKRLLRLFPRARIEHIGSTAVLGSWAKPLIDVSVGLPRGGSVHVADASAAGLEFRLFRPGSIVFRLRGTTGLPIGFVHVRARDSEPELEDIHFRNYLRAHPAATREYSKLKRRLAATRTLRGEYSRAKAPFIEKALERARQWAQKTNRRVGNRRGPS